MSFYHDRYASYPIRDGADGGVGGRVLLKVVQTLSSLNHIAQSYTGGTGGRASSKEQVGGIGDDVIIPVPPGTIVTTDLGESVDLSEPGSELVVALGGAGGLGNVGHAPEERPDSAEHPAVRGKPGEERRVHMELKTIADVGLVGLPNAGKSTFLTAVSNAHPKIAPYPFTTLNPFLGVVEFADFFRLTVADIPGLAIGAHQNVGLGHSFLRHIERTNILLYIIDMRCV